ncbi:MAG TPA: tetratricopeptide repeat protein, partial [Solirubrobacteraceae bacterium]
MESADTHAALSVARRFIEIGRPERALDALDRAGAGPEDEEAWGLRAWALAGLERWDDAARVIGDLLADDPEDVQMLALLSAVEEERGDLAAAERAVLSALRLETESAYLLTR